MLKVEPLQHELLGNQTSVRTITDDYRGVQEMATVPRSW